MLFASLAPAAPPEGSALNDGDFAEALEEAASSEESAPAELALPKPSAERNVAVPLVPMHAAWTFAPVAPGPSEAAETQVTEIEEAPETGQPEQISVEFLPLTANEQRKPEEVDDAPEDKENHDTTSMAVPEIRQAPIAAPVAPAPAPLQQPKPEEWPARQALTKAPRGTDRQADVTSAGSEGPEAPEEMEVSDVAPEQFTLPELPEDSAAAKAPQQTARPSAPMTPGFRLVTPQASADAAPARESARPLLRNRTDRTSMPEPGTTQVEASHAPYIDATEPAVPESLAQAAVVPLPENRVSKAPVQPGEPGEPVPPKTPMEAPAVSYVPAREAEPAAAPRMIAFTGSVRPEAAPEVAKNAEKHGTVLPAMQPESSNSSSSVPAAFSERTEAPARPPAHPRPETPMPVREIVIPHEARRQDMPAQSITVRLGERTDDRMDIRFVHRNGEMQMAVRTDSSDLAQRLRTELPELSQNLHNQGFRSEVRSSSAEADAHSHRHRQHQPDTFTEEQQNRQRRRFQQEETDDQLTQ